MPVPRHARRALRAFAIVSALVLCAFSAAADESTESAAEPGSSAAATATSSPPPEVAEARAQIQATLDQMRAVSLRVRDELRLARRRGMRREIECADQALSRADVAVRRAREAGDEILVAYAKGDVTRARAVRLRLSELREAQRLAAVPGASCKAPLSLATTGVTTVKLQVDPNIAPAR